MLATRNEAAVQPADPVQIISSPAADHPAEPGHWRGSTGRAALEQLRATGRACCVVLVAAEPDDMTIRGFIARARALAPGACLVRIAATAARVDPGFDRWLPDMPAGALLRRLLDEAHASHAVRIELAVAREQLGLALQAHAGLEARHRALLRWCAGQRGSGGDWLEALRRHAGLDDLIVPLPRDPVPLRAAVDHAIAAAGRTVTVTLGRAHRARVDPLLFAQAVEVLLCSLPDAAWAGGVRLSARNGVVLDCPQWSPGLAELAALFEPWRCDADGQPLPLGLARAARLAALAGAPAEARTGRGGRGVQIVLQCPLAALGPSPAAARPAGGRSAGRQRGLQSRPSRQPPPGGGRPEPAPGSTR